MKSIRVEVICVGTELLSHRVNTHTVSIGKILSSVGLQINRSQTIGDNRNEMKSVFSSTYKRANIIITAGGLGPTFDDITREVWASVLKKPLRFHADIVEEIRKKFLERGIKMPENNRRQGYLLKGADLLPNDFGTAPGQIIELGKKILILLPGPKRELIPMMQNHVVSRLASQFSFSFLKEKKYHLIGIPESKVDQAIRPLVNRYKKVNGCRVEYGILASNSVITVKFLVMGTGHDQIELAIEKLDKKFRPKLKNNMFGEDEDTLEKVVGKLLKESGKTCAVAESCTGGLVSKKLTDESGSSEFFVEGVVTYANRSKMKRLGVSSGSLKQFGAVSEKVAKEMALGIKKKANVDFSISITGIAGPTGGLPNKPVGTVYIGCSGPTRTFVSPFHFKGDRDWNRQRAALIALDILRKEILRSVR